MTQKENPLMFVYWFAAVKYSNDMTSLADRYMHLTNYSINKLSSQYTQNEDAEACQGHKWWEFFVFQVFLEFHCISWSGCVQKRSLLVGLKQYFTRQPIKRVDYTISASQSTQMVGLEEPL